MKMDNNTVALIVIGVICIAAAVILKADAKDIMVGGISVIGGFIGGVAYAKKDGDTNA